MKNEIKAWLRAEYVKVGVRSLSAIVKAVGIDDVIEVKYGKMIIMHGQGLRTPTLKSRNKES